jgi:hypothetical protein
MAIPIPLALSLVKIELKNAKAVKIIEIKQPIAIIINPTPFGELIKSGIPAPTKNAKTIDKERPKNKLIHIFFRLIGWLNKSSMNSALLYKYIVAKSMETNGTVNRITFKMVKIPLAELSSKANELQDKIAKIKV